MKVFRLVSLELLLPILGYVRQEGATYHNQLGTSSWMGMMLSIWFTRRMDQLVRSDGQVMPCGDVEQL